MVPEVTINKEQRLYVIPVVGALGKVQGYTTYGFENCRNMAKKLATEMGVPQPTGELGSLKLYQEYRGLVDEAMRRNRATGWRSQADLDPKLIGLEGQYVEVVNGFGETERFWVGKSTGWIPAHLAVKRRNSSGGMPVFGPLKSVRVLPPPRLSR